MKISVITINRNNRSGLQATIESVGMQSLPPYEFIVIDGASNDGSAALLDRYASIISFGVSEEDDGIYHAMNKGAGVAQGDYCIFMNAGDVFAGKDVLRKVAARDENADIIVGNAIILSTPPRKKTPPSEVTMRFLYASSFCHQAVFIRTELLARYPYDASLKYVADRKFFFEALILANASYTAVDVDVVNYDVKGISASHRFASEKEWQDVLSRLLPDRVLMDYGREQHGPLYGDGQYEKLMLETGRRKYRKYAYKLVYVFLWSLSLFRDSAKYVRFYSFKNNI